MSGSNGTRGTDAKKAKFLTAFESELTVSAACAQVNVGRTTVYRWRKEDAAFAEAWDQLDEQITDQLEREAYRRAVEGTEEPIFHRGQQVGSVKKYSDRMLEMLLRARKPEKYRDRVSIEDDREMARKRELERASEAELDEQLSGVPDNVTPLRRAS